MSKFSRFYALLNQMPHADKAEVVCSYSGGKTTSLREFLNLDPRGFDFMLSDLQNKSKPTQKPTINAKEENQKRRYRSLILRAMQDQGVTVQNCDWSDVNNFVSRYAGANKKLSTMTLDELKKFNSQVHKLLDYYNAKKEVLLRQAMLN